MNSKSNLGVFYLEKDKAFFYSDNLPSVLNLALPADVIYDLEVVDKEKFFALIQSFLESRKIAFGYVIVLLAPSLTFDKDLPELPLDKLDKEVKKFLELVPFENVSSKIVKLEKKWKVTAANKEFCELLKLSFKKLKFLPLAIAPLSIVQEVIPELAKNLNLRTIIDKADMVKQYSLLKTEEIADNTSPKTDHRQANKRLIFLTIILAALIILLAIVVLTGFLPQTTPTY